MRGATKRIARPSQRAESHTSSWGMTAPSNAAATSVRLSYVPLKGGIYDQDNRNRDGNRIGIGDNGHLQRCSQRQCRLQEGQAEVTLPLRKG